VRPREAVEVEVSNGNGPLGSVLSGIVLSDTEPVCGLFDLPELVSSIANRFTAAAREKSVWLELKRAQTLPRRVVGDADAIGQVMAALIDNAVKFTDEGEIVASVLCEEAVSGRTLLQFELSDTGAGIPSETLEHLFDSSRCNRPPVAPSPDAGGLIRSRWLVELMDGRFGCSSEIGMGTTVWFTVPLDLPGA
jgi:signal transduction histidine kinase